MAGGYPDGWGGSLLPSQPPPGAFAYLPTLSILLRKSCNGPTRLVSQTCTADYHLLGARIDGTSAEHAHNGYFSGCATCRCSSKMRAGSIPHAMPRHRMLLQRPAEQQPWCCTQSSSICAARPAIAAMQRRHLRSWRPADEASVLISPILVCKLDRLVVCVYLQI